MPRTPADRADASDSYYAGLAALAHEETVFLKLKPGSFDFLRSKHRLTVFSSVGNQDPLYVFVDDVEDKSCCDCVCDCCGENGFTLVMKDAADGRDILVLEETQSGCTCDNTVDGIGIRYVHENERGGRRGPIPVGYVQKTTNYNCGSSSFGICDATGSPVLGLESVVSCCGGIEYGLYRYECGTRIGTVPQEFGGCCSSSTTLAISFPMQLTVELKACVIGGAVLLLYYAMRAAQRQETES